MRTLLSSSASSPTFALFSPTWKQIHHCSWFLLKSSYSTNSRLLRALPTTVRARACLLRPRLSVPICIKPCARRTLTTMISSDASTSLAPVSMDTRSARVQVLSSKVEKPELDDRSYRLIRLSDNKLEALLVHDPKTDKSSAAMDVHVGHLSDPKDFPGLAHALEHCLFLGNRFQIPSYLISYRYKEVSRGERLPKVPFRA